jgi:GH43 family beta-xylosidase
MFTLTTTRRATGAQSTFANPIAPGADPWVVRHGEHYFWCVSDCDLGVAVYRSDSLTDLGEKFVVWSAPESGPYSAQVWAPELHFLDGRWYIYVAASNGKNETHRMIVLESDGEDPTQPFHFKAELYTGDDLAGRTENRWAIDGTVLEHGGCRYMLWSGWQDEKDEQWLYIAPMANPWTLAAARTRICANDDYLWERVGETPGGRGLNEGPQVLVRDGRVFVVYSCSGSWEASYKLGLLELEPGADPLEASSWRKFARPVFEANSGTLCGVGHCSFTRSPDGTEDWIVYHAKVSPRHGWERVVRAQRFSWTADGRPNFGTVIPNGIALLRPSGEWPVTVATPLAGLIEEVTINAGAGEASGEPVAA